MNVSTALIMVSGYGSRMLPVTAAVQKELLPILDRPVVDYVVADCVAAGITRIIFVVRPDSAFHKLYVANPPLENHLKRFNKTEALDRLQAMHSQANFEFVNQPENEADYGSAVPVRIALPHFSPDEAVLVCGGDDFVWHSDPAKSEIKDFVATFRRSQAAGALITLERPASELFRYGVLKLRQVGEYQYLEDLVEKPTPSQAPSNLINISKYILTPTILTYIRHLKANPISQEFYLTDAVLAAAKAHPIVVHQATGEYLDTGNVANWLHANITVAKSRPELTLTLHDARNK